nr:MAG TPA: hypothetical protein [Caudoviricetes sp.]
MNSFFISFFLFKYATESYLCCVYYYFFETSNNALFIYVY